MSRTLLIIEELRGRRDPVMFRMKQFEILMKEVLRLHCAIDGCGERLGHAPNFSIEKRPITSAVICIELLAALKTKERLKKQTLCLELFLNSITFSCLK